MAVRMAPQFTKYLNFGSLPAIEDMTLMSLFFWINVTSWGDEDQAGDLAQCYTNEGGNKGRGLDVYLGSASKFVAFRYGWSTTDGLWATAAASVSTGFQSIGVTYNAGSTANDPVFYINGSSEAVDSQPLTPAGSIQSWAGDNFYIGDGDEGNDAGAPSIDFYAARVWKGTILTAADMAALHNFKSHRLDGAPLPDFSCKFLGAAGIQDFDGASLGTSNKVPDDISGALGTPTNTLAGLADAQLGYGG
jgi:hypothetical protein